MTVNDNLLIEMSSDIGLKGMTQNKNDLAVQVRIETCARKAASFRAQDKPARFTRSMGLACACYCPRRRNVVVLLFRSLGQHQHRQEPQQNQ